jgi:hypothetical protein
VAFREVAFSFCFFGERRESAKAECLSFLFLFFENRVRGIPPTPAEGDRGVRLCLMTGYVGTTSYREEVQKLPKGIKKVP